jgi:hypothetical protein
MDNHPFGSAYKGDVNKFIQVMLPNSGFAKWLNVLRDKSLTEQESKLLVETYIKYGERLPTEIPATIRLLERQYNIEFEIPSEWYQSDFWKQYYQK